MGTCNLIRNVVDACADCDTCRYLMDENCLFFPELYRLYDKIKDTNTPITDSELKNLSNLCTLCGQCPCPNVRSDIIKNKANHIRIHGMPVSTRLLNDIRLLGRLHSLIPLLIDYLLSFNAIKRIVKNLLRIHPERQLPQIPQANFFAWAKKRGLNRKSDQNPRIAYFTGCSAGVIYPEVARASVSVMEHNDIKVYVPQQKCCGMPAMFEGDMDTVNKQVFFNLDILLKAIHEGYEIVTSCPTCGYFMKILLKERAYYSEAYQNLVNAGSDEIKVPVNDNGKNGFTYLHKSIYKKILIDNGLFSHICPLKRIDLSTHIMDISEYLGCLHDTNNLKINFQRLDAPIPRISPIGDNLPFL